MKEKSELEQLLNSLIEKGWKPRWENNIKDMYVSKNNFNEDIVWVRWSKGWCTKRWWTFRELVSKESNLWQFVCENGMIEIEYWKIREKYDGTVPTTDKNKVITYKQLLWEDNYEYRLIEAALKDESELEDFLLNSIKID